MNRFQSWYRMQPVALRALLTINVVIYVLWSLLFVHIDSAAVFIVQYLALDPEWPGILFKPWQLVTYSFLHLGTGFGGFIHILFNMLWLVWIGREYEELHGPHRLLALYVYGSLGGALLTVLLHAAFPGVGPFGGPVHGASASVLGIMTAVGVLYPFKSVGLLFIGTVRLIYIVIGFLALDLLFLAGSGTSVSAHIGGALFGLLYARLEQRQIDLASWARVFFPERRRGRRQKPRAPQEEGVLSRMESWLASRGGQKEERTRPATIHHLHKPEQINKPAPTTLEREVDRILDKISAAGYESLTDEEKRTLYEASKK